MNKIQAIPYYAVSDIKEPCNFISILDSKMPEVIVDNKNCKNKLTLIFDDIKEFIPEYPEMVLFNESMAQEVFDFYNQHKDNGLNWYIQCTAGASRSYAIARCLADNVGLQFINANENEQFLGNKRVYKYLNHLFLEG